MRRIVDKIEGLTTVGEVIEALSRFDRDAPIGGGLDQPLRVWREVDDEAPEDHGTIHIEEGGAS